MTTAAGIKPTPFRNPVQFLAFGFGSGLSPWAPGTAGTLVAVPIFMAMATLPLIWYSALVLLSVLVGVAICGIASRQLQVHDHAGIVWDEFAGYWITMWALPPEPAWLVAGFLLFRLLDIAKPWPIRVLDKRVAGGLGIMIDDVIAGLVACAVLHGVRLLWFS